MEHKIGEIITLPDGRKVEVVEVPIGSGCESCSLDKDDYCTTDALEQLIGRCLFLCRSDNKNVIYKEVK